MNGSIFQNFPKFGSNFKNILENLVILLKIWPKIGPIGIWIGHFFLEELVFVWVYFQIRQQHVPTKTKLEYPPPLLENVVTVLIFSLYPQLFKMFSTDDPPSAELIRIPQLLDLFLQTLFNTKTTMNPDHRHKYTYLLAYAVCVHETWKKVSFFIFCLFVCLSVGRSVCLSVILSFCHFVYPSVCLVCLMGLSMP